MFWIMPVDNERCCAEIGNFNECLHYAFNKPKIILFNIMIRVSSCVFACNATLQPFHNGQL